MKIINYINTTIALLALKKYVLLPFVVTQKLSFKLKIAHLFLTSLLISPFAWFSELILNHVILSKSFVSILVILLFVDMVTGMMKHWKLHTFDWGEMFKGLLVKTAISFMGMAVFNALASMEEFSSFPSLRDYVILIGKLCNFLYVGGSAFNNMYIVTDGKFPPKAWMARMKQFGKSLSIKDLASDAKENKEELGKEDELLKSLLEEEKEDSDTGTDEETPIDNVEKID